MVLVKEEIGKCGRKTYIWLHVAVASAMIVVEGVTVEVTIGVEVVVVRGVETIVCVAWDSMQEQNVLTTDLA